ncbi:uncharacterized protein LOC9640731 isoform X1 [Selaginella moellendorffii]|uniref:uncharacterized protein LOC9640731 isoform X1 n=1 Tax=Selaginella moellendorffii TaxID=88036 RepID=UPI000D1C2BDA|nr:uncharacterized protein LOC9640731 isoform X1 [Selaginella moellendorffii]|eukprot:XP_024515628.1 uncharacterized protein LOC9640731 isoform X1 [Selaginella moellendorffii]
MLAPGEMLLIARECPASGCSQWIFRYLKDCVCDVKDGVSFSLGLISVLSWGIAEVPQIITNYKEKSTEGVSLVFLMTWVVGDFFNIAGCLLEPATLPTQFYMALLYTLTTLVLVAQTIYYGQIAKRHRPDSPSIEEPLIPPEKQARRAQETPVTPVTSQPISSISVPSPSPRQFYYTSARSLTRSHTPTAGSYLSTSGVKRGDYLSSHPSLSNLQAVEAQIVAASHLGKSEPRMIRSVAASLMMFGGYALHSRWESQARSSSGGHVVFSSARRLLQDSGSHSRAGEMLGWGMAAIYMGGRVPQIWLNITRGTVEGLNPMMFFCALMGNATYVGSILVRSTDWTKLKPNMPWLVDAAVCVILDFFILAQFCYYHRFVTKCNSQNSGSEEGLVEKQNV